VGTIDEMFADLAPVPAGQDRRWRLWNLLFKLDPDAGPPQGTPPAWFNAAVTEVVRHAATRDQHTPVFPAIRLLERHGVVHLEHDDLYTLALVGSLGDRWHPQLRPDAIRADAELRDTLLWRVFEVEGGGEVSLANVDKYARADCSWTETFRVLVADGTLPRDRVLGSCLQALGRDFSAYRAGFFSRLYTTFEPGIDELVEAQSRFLRLLRSGVAATVSFAAGHLLTVEQAGRLDDPAFLAGCVAALAVPQKKTPLTVLRITAGIGERRPDLAADVVAVAAAALEHPHRDVQLAALALLRRFDARQAVADRLELLEPTVARQAADWAAAPLPAPAHEQEPAATGGPARLPDDRSAAECAAALLAGDTDPWLIERFLAVVASGTARDELAALAGPARKALRNGTGLQRSVAALVQGQRPDGGKAFLTRRLAEVTPGVPPLLATPTGEGGWVDPDVFAARLAAWNGAPLRHDLIAALLRIAPAGREAALRAVRDMPGDLGAAVRYALGGPPAPIGDQAVWVAAARTRAPLDDDPHLLAAGLDGAGRGHAARCRLTFDPQPHRYQDHRGWHTYTWWRPVWSVKPHEAPAAADQPTVVEPDSLQPDRAAWAAWAAWSWPHDAEPFFAATAAAVVSAAGTDATYGVEDILDALRTHPGRLGPMAAATLAAGLTAQGAAHRTRSAEVFAAIVPTGRLPLDTLAAVMVAMAGHATATRWAGSLRAAAVPRTVVDLLALVLPQLPNDHQGLHALLDTLHEERVRCGAGGSPRLAAWLAGFAGTSKAARTARALAAELR
jgi:hypothetical protein